MSEKVMTVMQEKDLQKTTSAQRITKVLVKCMVYAFLIVMALVVVFPFYFMLISSVKSLAEYQEPEMTFFPREVFLSNYSQAFKKADLGQLFRKRLENILIELLMIGFAVRITDKCV